MLKDRANGQVFGTKILLDACMSKDKAHLARLVLDGEMVDGAQTPLISSALLPDGRARCRALELLLGRGSAVDRRDGAGRTALSHACERGHLDAVKVLVRSGADPELADRWGNSALMYAAAAGHAPVVGFLVRAFKRLGLLQVHRRNQAGNCALDVAKFLGHVECVFALTDISKRIREAGGRSLGGGFESKVGRIADQMELLQTRDDQQRPRTQLASMESIEELEREQDASSSTNLHTSLKQLQTEESPTSPDEDHLLPLTHREVQRSTLFSPSPGTNPPGPSALDILLTPIPSSRSEAERGAGTSNIDPRRPGFNDSYYKKRCSLPTSMLGTAAPRMAARKSKTIRRRDGCPGAAGPADPLELPAPSSSSSSTFSAFSNKLFRRFTSPEFQKGAGDPEQNPIPRSETFPQAPGHARVDSSPSIDSISAVRCEFDFHSRKPKP